MNSVLDQIKPKREIILLLCIMGLCFSLRMAFLHEPFERDEGFYSCIAQTILRGGLPYRDAIDLKPPGVFYVYAAAIALLGKTTEAIRIFTAFYTLLTLLSVYWLARHIYGKSAGLFAAAIFALCSGAPLVQGSSSNSEVIMVLPLMLSSCFFVAALSRKQRGFFWASGFFAGLAILVKTVAVPYVALMFVSSLLCTVGKNRITDRLLNTFAFVTPMIVLVMATAGYFYANGALSEFIYWNVTMPLIYSKGGGVSGPLFSRVISYLAPELLLPALLALPTALWLLLGRRDLKSAFVALLVPAAFLGVWMPGKFFPHYFIQLFPFMAVLGGIGCARLLEKRGTFLYLSAPLIAVALYYYIATDYKLFFVYSPETVSTIKYGSVFADTVYIARYLKERTSPSDYIYQWGFEPEIYFLADRRCPGPFISSTVLGSMQDPDRAVQSMMAELDRNKPKYIIVQPEWSSWPGVDAIENLLRTEYVLETTLRYAYIFRRLDRK